MIAIASGNLNLILQPSSSSLALTNPIYLGSLQEDFNEQRKKTEFVDDNMEKMLNRNKKWFILMILGLTWLAYKSLFSSRQP
jgi:hypothetical protein